MYFVIPVAYLKCVFECMKGAVTHYIFDLTVCSFKYVSVLLVVEGLHVNV